MRGRARRAGARGPHAGPGRRARRRGGPRRDGRAGGGASRSRQTPPTEGGGVVDSAQPPARETSAGRTTGWYAARSASVSRPPRPVTSRLICSASSPRCSTPGPVAGDQLERGHEVGHHDPPGRELALVVVEDGPALRVPPEDVVVGVVEVVARRRGQPVAAPGDLDRRRDQLAPRQPAVAPVGLAERGQAAVHRHRARPDGDVHPAAVRRRDVPGRAGGRRRSR